jgi:hypothetical protein
LLGNWVELDISIVIYLLLLGSPIVPLR